MTDEECDKRLENIGLNKIRAVLIANGWGGKSGWPTQKWVWISAAEQVEKEQGKLPASEK